MFNRNRRPPTEAETEHMLLVKSLGCVCCLQLEELHTTGMPVEFNHHKRGNKRIGQTVGTGECQWHHRGVPHEGFQMRTMLLLHGPSRVYQGGKGGFAARFGTDSELLERQEALIRGKS